MLMNFFWERLGDWAFQNLFKMVQNEGGKKTLHKFTENKLVYN